MKMYLGVTDKNWFQLLAQRAPDEVNFWRPSGNAAFHTLDPNTPFLFKLHRPQSYIVGGGFFVSYQLYRCRYGTPYLAAPRLGQGAFRVLVTTLTRADARLQENGRYQSCKPAISNHSPKMDRILSATGFYFALISTSYSTVGT